MIHDMTSTLNTAEHSHELPQVVRVACVARANGCNVKNIEKNKSEIFHHCVLDAFSQVWEDNHKKSGSIDYAEFHIIILLKHKTHFSRSLRLV
jgi:hypothetical protein